MRCAFIVDGNVKNIISVHPMNASSFPNAVPTGELPVTVGDTYADGVFYRDGVEVTFPTSPEEENADMKEALALLGVTMDE